MANASISGLVSGLDTASIIDQLMQLEAAPQNRLRSQQDIQKKVVSALQALNTDTALLASRAAALAKPTAWQTLKPTSSNPLVTVSGTPTAATSFSVTVQQTAVAHQVSFAFAAKTTDVVTTGPMRLDFTDSAKAPISLTTDGTLQGLADAINDPAKATGLTATIVRTGADATTGAAQYGLVVTANKTGLASGFSLTYDDNGGAAGTTLAQQSAAVRTGTDAKISMGAGLTLTSSTNTFSDVVPGVSLTISESAVGGATPTTATVTVAQDTATAKAGLKDLVAQVNKLLSTIDTQTAGSTSTTAAGILAGDATARSLRNALVETVFGDGTTSMASLGLQTDRKGMLVFDDVAFDKAYAADPAGTAAKFTSGASTATDGWLARVATVAKAASDSTTGTLSQAITGRNSTISEMDKSIAGWDLRLELRRTSLQQQYTALETALSNMQSQGTWLAGQIAQLPKSS